MPLSDEEMRLLEQMERALVEEDPKFASTLRGTRFARATRTRIVAAGAGFAIGIVALMTGAIMGSTLGTVIGIVGFVLMLASATIGLGAWRGRQATAEAPSAPDSETMSGLSLIQGGRAARKPRRQKSPSSGGSFMQRMEERWQRRRGGQGGY